jgi:hypothetical protein
MQDRGALNHFQQANEVMSGQAELAFLQDDAAIFNASHDSSSAENIALTPKLSRSRYLDQRTSSFNFSSKQISWGMCSVYCRCKCHSMPARQFPTLLQKLLKSLFPTLRGKPSLVHSCNVFNCRRRNAGRARIIVLHAMLLKRAITLSTLSQGFKIKVHLRIHPIVPDSSDIIRFSEAGDFPRLEKLIRTGQATVFDTSSDGWTPLHVRVRVLLKTLL